MPGPSTIFKCSSQGVQCSLKDRGHRKGRQSWTLMPSILQRIEKHGRACQVARREVPGILFRVLHVCSSILGHSKQHTSDVLDACDHTFLLRGEFKAIKKLTSLSWLRLWRHLEEAAARPLEAGPTRLCLCHREVLAKDLSRKNNPLRRGFWNTYIPHCLVWQGDLEI